LALILPQVTAGQGSNGQKPVPIQSPRRDPQAIALLKKSLIAAGWSASPNPRSDFKASGTIIYYSGNAGQVSGAATVRGRGSRQFRLDAELPQGSRSIIINNTAWTLKEASGRVNSVSHLDVGNLGVLTFPYPGIAEAANDPMTWIMYVGDAEVAGRPVQQVHIWHRVPYQVDPTHVRVRPAAADYFVDVATGLVLRVADTSLPVDPSRKDYPHEIDFADYKYINGVNVPMLISEKSMGQNVWELRLTSMAFNTGVGESEFGLE
jgi:hypothetical protein